MFVRRLIGKYAHYWGKDLGGGFSSVQFSRSVVSDSLRPHEPQHTKLPCPSPTPRVHPNPCPSSRWCHPIISSSVVPFSSCPQSFPASGSFQMSQLFASGGQSGPLEKGIAHHFSIPALRTPWTVWKRGGWVPFFFFNFMPSLFEFVLQGECIVSFLSL